MRKLLMFFVALLTLAAATPAHAAKRSIMGLPLFERAVLIIKKFETMHHPKHWPYVGYGHCVQPGEPYRRGVQLTEAQADALLRKDLRKFCALYSQYGKDSVLLGTLAYNCGPGVVNKSSILKKLRRGDRNIFKEYTAHCRYKGKTHDGLLKRRIIELHLLFVR
ncbi:glycoside hydrolase family protein [uncultured Muribaculum sp.]|uniref:glycoside hydrolase family protein n=1 Tax=uncultured Muribaculum sp. TaxID=1918613 RepID=UPI0027313B98|nr:glycoside hydrolase family protein [uncultured Muribaculum sp.]